ncbi:uncharacterized protein LOC130053872 [Ostrea edulis]|uniref:uncharacterized protein LOC130053872 n=1 Tax=Ostrea edulis TaxID=37623 RepID=UPI0024AFB406|nr:uncharacterized protein LOC130053872 [Ostrea edulis]
MASGGVSEKTELRQQRSLTDKGLEVYEGHVKKYKLSLHEIQQTLDSIIASAVSYPPVAVINELKQQSEHYLNVYTEFCDYLVSVRSEQSDTEKNNAYSMKEVLMSFIHDKIKELEWKSTHDPLKTEHMKSESLDKIVPVFTEPNMNKQSSPIRKENSHSKAQSIKSHLSAKSKHLSSTHSHVSSLYVKQKAKLEEARVRLKFAEKEADILREQANLNAKLKILESERQLEECAQGLSAMDEFLDVADSNSSVSDPELSNTVKTRTRQYVHDVQLQDHEHLSQTNISKIRVPVLADHPVNEYKTLNDCALDMNANRVLPKNDTPLNPEATPFVKREENICIEFSKYIVKKDMLLKRIHDFDDRPESFGSWKKTFRDVVSELNLSAAEEVDLLIRYLGPESKKSAITIRSANYSDPNCAKDRIWQRLSDRYARPEMVESSVKQKLLSFPKITNKDFKRLYELVDIVVEIDSLKNEDQFKNLFASYDSSAGVNLIVAKLPYQLQERWTTEASRYKEENDTAYPPFHVFVTFLEKMARRKNDPSFAFEDSYKSKQVKSEYGTRPISVSVKKVDIPTEQEVKGPLCPLHKTSHSLNKCFQFRQKPIQERKEFLSSKGLCFKCCGHKPHLAKHCRSTVKCGICKSTHPTALHEDRIQFMEQTNNCLSSLEHEVTTRYTTLSGSSRSCAKTLLARVYQDGQRDRALELYVIIDEQSNRSLARSSLFDHFGISGPELPYSLSSCSGLSTEYGRRCSNLIIESFDSSCKMKLPTLIECDQIPDQRDEIPSPSAAKVHSHLSDLADAIPPIRDESQILLLLGRDLLPAHHILEQRLGPIHAPFAQRLRLGWVIIGDVCLGTSHKPDEISVMKTFTLKDGRTTMFQPCMSNMHVANDHIFEKRKDDDTPGLSYEDKQFLEIMDKKMYKGQDGCWTAPLPFRQNRQYLPNNKPQAMKRARMLDANLRRNPEKMKHAIGFMKKILDCEHAEEAPELHASTECWYLPLFAVYHPKKPGNIRCVFDSSAKYGGVSLNDVLLTGPDLVNSLLGILLRFRQGPVAITADIEQMFYRFSVPDDHRNYLRFMWYKDNEPSQEMIEYRMTRHVFGNSPSPAVATFGLRKCVSTADEDVKSFVLNNFYVDDALMSVDTCEEAISILSRTQTILKEEGNIRLHKVSSNSLNVIKSFPTEDLAKEVIDINLDLSEASLHRSLGVSWDVFKDSFTFRVYCNDRPFTKRGLLATINSLYDPIGFVSPVTIGGKFILQDVMSTVTDWDEPLSQEFSTRWRDWKESLINLESVVIPRCYANLVSNQVTRRELHVFSDASSRAIGAVAYLRIFDVNGDHHISFVLGKSRVAPTHGHTIPRLELCAAVLACNIKDTVTQHLSLDLDSTTMYTDSKIVLGYINNERRRFYVYVSNRVDMIRQSTSPNQWTYISSEENPADIATRSIAATDITQCAWIQGPMFLHDISSAVTSAIDYQLIDPSSDIEVRPLINASKTTCASQNTLGVHRFERFSDLYALLRAIAHLKRLAKYFSNSLEQSKPFGSTLTSHELLEAEIFVLKEVQWSCFSKEISALKEGRNIPKSSAILPLTPILDDNGILRVGGRLKRYKAADALDFHPVIIPRKHHIGEDVTSRKVKFEHQDTGS